MSHKDSPWQTWFSSLLARPSLVLWWELWKTTFGADTWYYLKSQFFKLWILRSIFFKYFILPLIWLHRVLVEARKIFSLCCSMQTLSCSIWDLVPWPGFKPRSLVLGVEVLASGPPGKSLKCGFLFINNTKQDRSWFMMCVYFLLWVSVNNI